MSYLERYEAGEFKSVWKEMQSLNLEQAGQRIRDDAFDTARETMQRAKWNLNSLIQSLESLGYEFGYDEGNGFQKSTPVISLEPEYIEFVLEFGKEINNFIPYSFQIWLEAIGLVDLRGHHPEWKVEYPDALVIQVSREDFEYEYRNWADTKEDDLEKFILPFAPDSHHKENVSGGPPYSIELGQPSMDARVVDEPHNLYFMDYLQLCFSFGGFPGFKNMPLELKNSLTAGFLPF